MQTFSQKVLDFNFNLDIKDVLPSGISFMNPYLDPEVVRVNLLFYEKYYNDINDRILILGINPGRHGGGVTGLSFTDPVILENDCGIVNSFKKRGELSAQFVYETIYAFGGPETFFSKFLLSSICPLGFMKDGKNYNYYEDKSLQEAIMPFIKKTIVQQIDLGIDRSVCICYGEGKNYKFLDKLNRELGLFKKILPLPHPRFIMQYRRKRKDEFIKNYLKAYNSY